MGELQLRSGKAGRRVNETLFIVIVVVLVKRITIGAIVRV